MKNATKIGLALMTGELISRKLILLAYLEYHYNNPGLHPDDVFTTDGGYDGVGSVIVHIASQQPMPAYVKYPAELLQLTYAIDKLLPQTEVELQHIEVVKNFLDSFSVELLNDAIHSLSELVSLDKLGILERVKEILGYVNTL